MIRLFQNKVRLFTNIVRLFFNKVRLFLPLRLLVFPMWLFVFERWGKEFSARYVATLKMLPESFADSHDNFPDQPTNVLPAFVQFSKSNEMKVALCNRWKKADYSVWSKVKRLPFHL